MKQFLIIMLSLLPALLAATPYNIAPKAHISSSSTSDDRYSAGHVADGEVRIMDKGEWRSDSHLDMRGRVYPYPWIQLDWESEVNINKVVLYDRPNADSHTAAGNLIFSDGSTIQVNLIPNNGSPKVVDFASKNVKWIRFQVTDGEGPNLGLSEIEVYPSPESYSDYVSWVNPYIETSKGRYFFFVTGSLPFGMMSSAPLTRNINQGGGGYSYNSTRVLGFPQIHDWMVSGLNLMPVCGRVDVGKGMKGWSSSFSHDGEEVQPGYHRLFLDRYGIWVEQTVTDRVGFYKLTYTQDAVAKVLLDLGGHISTSTMVNAHASRVGDNEIAGYFDTTGRVWGGADNVRIYFAVRFDRPFKTLNSWVGDSMKYNVIEMKGSAELYSVAGSSFRQSPSSGLEADFGNVEPGTRILVKTAFSFVSIADAKENIDSECPSWNFDKTRRDASDVWNRWFGRIDVKGGTNQQKIKFYTDLWHVLLGRHKIDDVSGAYPDYLTGGSRMEKATRIHTLSPQFRVRLLSKDDDGKAVHHMYNSDALWLTQWNLNTLWGLAYPSLLDDFSASFLQYARNGGLLPRGPSGGAYTYIMTGCPATSMITSAYERGISHKWNPSEALNIMIKNHEKGGMMAFDMDDELDFYVKHGYCPGNAGLTIQWAFEDWALASMAQKMGRNTVARRFLNRSKGWKTSFNQDLKLMMPRQRTGEWLHLNPLSEDGFVQANAWQATFGLSHDIPGLARMMGGNDSLAVRLDGAFRKSASKDFLFSYVSYANQPGCSAAHVFSHVGYPWLTQYWVRRVEEQVYGAITPEWGYTGNDEDQGQMAGVSALMAIGLFSLDGGSASVPCYDITSPVFDEITIKLDSDYYSGKQFRIVTHNNSKENCYIQRATLNGKLYSSYQLLHSDFAKGGILELWLGNTPNKNWGRSF